PATQLSPLSLHDALPICGSRSVPAAEGLSPRRDSVAWRDRSLAAVLVAGDAAAFAAAVVVTGAPVWAFLLVPLGLAVLSARGLQDRKSTRLNSSHDQISY